MPYLNLTIIKLLNYIIKKRETSMQKTIIPSAVLATFLCTTNIYADMNNTQMQDVQNITVSTTIESNETHLDTPSNNTLIDTKISKAKAIIAAKTKMISDSEANAIAEAESKAIAKAQAIESKAIAEAEAKRIKIIAEATRAKTIAEAEAIKAKRIAEIKARAISERKITETKAKAAKAQAIAQAEATKIKAELVFEETMAKAKAQIEAILDKEKEFNQTETNVKVEAEDDYKIEDIGVLKNISNLLETRKIEFKKGYTSLTKEGTKTVTQLAKILQKYPKVSIEIAGYTDSDGSEELNQKLSQERVDTVKKTLMDKGISSERLMAKGYGETDPLVPNTSKKNKNKNRRIEIHIVEDVS